MRSRKGILISVALAVIFLFSVAAYASDSALTKKADALNKIYLLKGNGTDYNLSGQILRSEASTFIVRLLGKEDYVLDNKDKYKTVPYKDVKGNEWFVPYIAYCTEQGIIKGFPDGKFAPNQNISEKALLKLVLCAMGYTYGVDFDWNNLYLKAYDVGLVTDDSYKTKTGDNDKYTRGSVVSVLYNSLNKKIKGKDLSVINSLIESGAVSADTAFGAGVVLDEPVTGIKKADAVSETKLTLELNEDIQKLDKAQIKIYEKDNSKNTLDVTIESQTGNIIVLKTSAQVGSKIYTVELNRVKDGYGNLANVTSSFTGFKKPDAELTSVKEVSVVSGSKITVKFSEAVKSIAASNIKVYESDASSSTLTVSIESQSSDSITLTTSLQKEDKAYTIEFLNVEDEEGNTVASVKGSFTGYKSPVVKSDYFTVSKVEPISKSFIKIYFTQPININTEIQMYYEILKGTQSFVKGDSGSMVVKTSLNDEYSVGLWLKNQSFNDNESYTLKISGDLTSAYGLKINDGTGSSTTFVGVGKANQELSVVSVRALDTKTVQVEFNAEMDPSSVQNIANYFIEDKDGVPRGIVKAVLTSDSDKKGKIVKLGIAGTLDTSKIYKLTMNNIKDRFNQFTLNSIVYDFIGNVPAKADLKIVNVFPESKGVLMVYFDRPVDESSAMFEGNYLITGITNGGYVAVPAKLYFDAVKSPYAVKLYLPADKQLGDNGSYKLTILRTFQDEMGDISSNDIEYTFSGTSQQYIKPLIYEAKIVAKDAICLKISSELSNKAPNTLASNFSLEYKEGSTTKTIIPDNIGYINPTTLILKSDAISINQSYTLKFTALEDYAEINTRTSVDGMTSIGVTVGN